MRCSTRRRSSITGATGKIAFPIARALAQRNEVWGAARLRDPADRDKLTAAGITPLALDMSTGDFSALPDDFTYVFHAAVDTGTDDWTRCVETNAQNSGRPAPPLPQPPRASSSARPARSTATRVSGR